MILLPTGNEQWSFWLYPGDILSNNLRFVYALPVRCSSICLPGIFHQLAYACPTRCICQGRKTYEYFVSDEACYQKNVAEMGRPQIKQAVSTSWMFRSRCKWKKSCTTWFYVVLGFRGGPGTDKITSWRCFNLAPQNLSTWWGNMGRKSCCSACLAARVSSWWWWGASSTISDTSSSRSSGNLCWHWSNQIGLIQIVVLTSQKIPAGYGRFYVAFGNDMVIVAAGSLP